MTPDEIALATAALCDGSLDETGRAQLAAALRHDRLVRDQVLRDIRTALVIGELLAPVTGERTVARLHAVLTGDTDQARADLVARVRHLTSPRRRWLGMAAAGLALAILALGTWWLKRDDALLPVVVEARDGGVAVGERITLDREIATTSVGGLSLRLSDGTTARLGASGRLRVESVRDAHRLRLDRGQLGLSVEPQARPFTLVTPHARVMVLGTRFSVEVGEGSTRVMVSEGRVRFIGNDGAEHIVTPGETALARRDAASPPGRSRLAPGWQPEVHEAAAAATGASLIPVEVGPPLRVEFMGADTASISREPADALWPRWPWSANCWHAVSRGQFVSENGRWHLSTLTGHPSVQLHTWNDPTRSVQLAPGRRHRVTLDYYAGSPGGPDLRLFVAGVPSTTITLPDAASLRRVAVIIPALGEPATLGLVWQWNHPGTLSILPPHVGSDDR